MHRLRTRPLLAAWIAPALFFAFLAPAAGATHDEEKVDETAEYIRSHYSKFEYRVPMRDGVKLFTSVYVPNDRSRTYPVLLFRTPYRVAPYGADQYPERLGPSEDYPRDGYIFVYQDVRGRFMSEGEFLNMRPHQAKKSGPKKGTAAVTDESTDTYDTIEWLLEEIPGHNGRVGQWGISYPGFYTAAGVIDSHPALVAVSPQAPIADWFWDDMHHHGAFVLPLAFRFFSTFGVAREGLVDEWPEGLEYGTPDGYQFFLDLGPLKNVNEKYFKGEIDFWNKLAAHPNYDEFWQSRNLLPHLKNISAAVLTVGGWFDTEDLYGPLKIYRSIEEKNPGIFNSLVMGPWPHGGWGRRDGRSLGDADFGFATSEFYRERVELPFFRHFLHGKGEIDIPEALAFETGANRWRSFDEWPPKAAEPRRLYLQDEGGLSFEAPTADDAEAGDAYVSDPAKPVPYTMEITTRWARNYMTEDQRFAAWRPDVLVYRSEPLTEDLTLAGPIQADLWVSTSGTASDWIVKVIDEFPGEVKGWDEDSGEANPGGTQRLVRAEAFRGRFRNSYEKPEPFVPGQPTQVSFEVQDLLHTFKAGHRIMIQIQSSWFPFIDRNPQTYVPNIFEAEEDDFVAVTNKVYRSKKHPTSFAVGVLPAKP